MPHTPVATILVAEPDVAEAAALRHTLEREGHQVLSASRGAETRHIARFDLPDLILLAAGLDDEDGFATCRRLKGHPQTRDIPVLFLVSRDGPEDRVRGFEAGAEDCIIRPYDSAELVARTRVRLRLKRRREQALACQGARLEQVRRAQQALMPEPEELPEARFGIGFIPVLEAGGDYYDVFSLGDGVTAYFVADVSGHDLTASFASPVLKAALRNHARPDRPPRDVLAAVNRALVSVLRDGHHVTACLVLVDRLRGRATLANAAHPDPFRVARNGEITALHADGDVLGAFHRVEFDQMELAVHPGERLFLYTDGAIEPLGGSNRSRAAGLQQLEQACRHAMTLPIRVAVPEVIVQLFSENAHMSDDLLLLGTEL